MAASEMIAVMKVLPGWMTVFSITEKQKQRGLSTSCYTFVRGFVRLRRSLNRGPQYF